MFPACTPQSAAVYIGQAVAFLHAFPAPFYQIGYFLSFQYLEVEIFSRISRLAEGSSALKLCNFLSYHSSYTYSFIPCGSRLELVPQQLYPWV